MPLYDEDGQSGSGYSPKPRLDIPAMYGDMDAPITRREMADILRKLKDWSQRLQFGREGFTVKSFPLTQPGLIAADIPWTFDQIVEDSNGFAKTYMDPDLTYYQVPPGMGRPYAINYVMEFALITENTDSFSYTGSMQEWTAPSGLLEGTVEFDVQGGGGGGALGGLAASITGKLTNVVVGQVFDIEVGNIGSSGGAGGWPDGGNGSAQAVGDGSGGGGRSTVRYDGDSLASSLIIAGGGGGAGRDGPSSNPAGGDAGLPGGSGADGEGATNVAGAGNHQAYGGTQSAGGVGTNLTYIGVTYNGVDGALGQGGDAPATPNSFAFGGGGGGGGYYGGGSGAGGMPAGVYGGGGGGGSSKTGPGVRGVVAALAGSLVAGSISATYFTATSAPSTAVVTKVWVAYAQYPNKDAYEEVRCVLSDNGDGPHSGAVILPLGEGDRVWMTVENTEATLGIINFTFGMYSQGQ